MIHEALVELLVRLNLELIRELESWIAMEEAVVRVQSRQSGLA